MLTSDLFQVNSELTQPYTKKKSKVIYNDKKNFHMLQPQFIFDRNYQVKQRENFQIQMNKQKRDSILSKKRFGMTKEEWIAKIDQAIETKMGNLYSIYGKYEAHKKLFEVLNVSLGAKPYEQTIYLKMAANLLDEISKSKVDSYYLTYLDEAKYQQKVFVDNKQINTPETLTMVLQSLFKTVQAMSNLVDFTFREDILYLSICQFISGLKKVQAFYKVFKSHPQWQEARGSYINLQCILAQVMNHFIVHNLVTHESADSIWEFALLSNQQAWCISENVLTMIQSLFNVLMIQNAMSGTVMAAAYQLLYINIKGHQIEKFGPEQLSQILHFIDGHLNQESFMCFGRVVQNNKCSIIFKRLLKIMSFNENLFPPSDFFKCMLNFLSKLRFSDEITFDFAKYMIKYVLRHTQIYEQVQLKNYDLYGQVRYLFHAAGTVLDEKNLTNVQRNDLYSFLLVVQGNFQNQIDLSPTFYHHLVKYCRGYLNASRRGGINEKSANLSYEMESGPILLLSLIFIGPEQKFFDHSIVIDLLFHMFQGNTAQASQFNLKYLRIVLSQINSNRNTQSLKKYLLATDILAYIKKKMQLEWFKFKLKKLPYQGNYRQIFEGELQELQNLVESLRDEQSEIIRAQEKPNQVLFSKKDANTRMDEF